MTHSGPNGRQRKGEATRRERMLEALRSELEAGEWETVRAKRFAAAWSLTLPALSLLVAELGGGPRPKGRRAVPVAPAAVAMQLAEWNLADPHDVVRRGMHRLVELQYGAEPRDAIAALKVLVTTAQAQIKLPPPEAPNVSARQLIEWHDANRPALEEQAAREGEVH